MEGSGSTSHPQDWTHEAVIAFVAALGPSRSGAAARPPTLAELATRVVTTFLVASARGDSEAACRVFPDYMPCVRGDEVPRPQHFVLGSVSLVDREHPVVFVDIERVRGFFVLERQGTVLVIVSANAD